MMERGLDLSRQALASLAQIPSNVVAHVERDGEPYALSLAQNRLTQLHGVHVFRNVLQLDLSGNQLQGLDGIESLQLLESLNLARNSLTTIDPLAALPRLRVLNAAENKLVQVDVLRQLKSIAVVDVSYNSISKWPQLSQVTTLESIDLSSNLLEAFPVTVAVRVFPRTLKRLCLAKNSIQEMCGIAALGLFLQKLEAIKLDGNPATQRIIRDGGCLDFLWVNLFASVSFAKGQGMRRDDFVVPQDVVTAVEGAVQRSDEVLLSEFLVTGTLRAHNPRPSVFEVPLLTTMSERHNDQDVPQPALFQQLKTANVEAPVVKVVPPPTPVAVLPPGETASNGLSKESKMELWKRMVSERKGADPRERPSIVAPQSSIPEVSASRPPSIPEPSSLTPTPVGMVHLCTSATSSIPAPRSDAKKVSAKPPAPAAQASVSASPDVLAGQVKTLSEQVIGMRKYVKIWVKREQLVREAAAKRIQRFIRLRQWKRCLGRAIRQRQARRQSEYGVEHFAYTAWQPQHLPPQQLHLHVYAIVIQRHLRGWLMRFRVSRWMYFTQAAEKIQSCWRQRRGQRCQIKRELGLFVRENRCIGPRPRDRTAERLENTMVALATDVRQLQRVFVIQEHVIARQSRELARYKQFVERVIESPVTKLQSLWRGYCARRQLPPRSTRLQYTSASKKGNEIAALTAEVATLKALVNSLLAKSCSSNTD